MSTLPAKSDVGTDVSAPQTPNNPKGEPKPSESSLTDASKKSNSYEHLIFVSDCCD